MILALHTKVDSLRPLQLLAEGGDTSVRMI